MVDSSSEKRISVTMVSNAMNHHQFPFCDSLYAIPDISFHFIASKPITQERLATGFNDLNSSREYIIRSYESDDEYNKARKLADESDFVIYGSAPYEFIKQRKRNGKWTFIYSERLFKETRGKDFFNVKTITACMLRYFFSSHKHLRLLCSSAYSFHDYRYFRFKQNEALKWGYFTPTSKLNYDELKVKDPKTIIWVGRMIHWKHAELAIELAKLLKESEISFKMKLIGDGPLADELKLRVIHEDLDDVVTFTGVLNTKKTRYEMEKSQIMIATSDYNEGWGAVINEGMASGCAVVASHLMGSVPFLISSGENGLIFQSGNIQDLFEKVKILLLNVELSDQIGLNAYKTITDIWNGRVAADRLADIFRHYQSGETDYVYDKDVCSLAPVLNNNWF